MAHFLHTLALVLGALVDGVASTTVAYAIPSSAPAGAAALDVTPIAISIEFDTTALYSVNVSRAWSCLGRIDRLFNAKAPLRIGGTTQDRAAYDAGFDGYFYPNLKPNTIPVTYYGPKLFELIASHGREVTIGFNRGDNNITNVLQAARAAKTPLQHVLGAVELGNEPDLYYSTWNKSVAVTPWNETQEGQNQASWFQAFLDVWDGPLPILSGGVYAVPIPLYADYPNTNYLISTAFNASVKAGVKNYCTHLYALSPADAKLPTEMNHAKTAADLANYVEKIAAARAVGRPYVIGETGFHGLETKQDATFGGALQVVDKTLLALSMGVQRLYYHQGGLGASQASFNWWSLEKVEAPFYGGYFAAMAISGGDKIIASDPGTNAYAQYAVYKDKKPYKIVLVNTEYYSGTGLRSSTTFQLAGLSAASVHLLRMTAGSSEVVTSLTQPSAGQLTIGGQYLANHNCGPVGEKRSESVDVAYGKASIVLQASEAVIVYLQ